MPLSCSPLGRCNGLHPPRTVAASFSSGGNTSGNAGYNYKSWPYMAGVTSRCWLELVASIRVEPRSALGSRPETRIPVSVCKHNFNTFTHTHTLSSKSTLEWILIEAPGSSRGLFGCRLVQSSSCWLQSDRQETLPYLSIPLHDIYPLHHSDNPPLEESPLHTFLTHHFIIYQSGNYQIYHNESVSNNYAFLTRLVTMHRTVQTIMDYPLYVTGERFC